MSTTVRLRHNKVELALHELRAGDGPPAAAPARPGRALARRRCPAHLARVAGPGVGARPLGPRRRPTCAVGGGYFCEVLMGDVDTALAHLGAVTIFGRGLGAYVGLLAAGGRAEHVRGAILADGPGLAGGGPVAGSPSITTAVGTAAARRHPRPVGACSS